MMPCLAQLFSFLTKTQRNPELLDGIQQLGPCNSVKTFGLQLAKEGIVFLLATSQAKRTHCTRDQWSEDLKTMPGVIAAVDGLVSQKHAEQFVSDDGKAIAEMEQYGVAAFRRLTGKLSKQDKVLLSTINTQAIMSTVGEGEAEGLRKTR